MEFCVSQLVRGPDGAPASACKDATQSAAVSSIFTAAGFMQDPGLLPELMSPDPLKVWVGLPYAPVFLDTSSFWILPPPGRCFFKTSTNIWDFALLSIQVFPSTGLQQGRGSAWSTSGEREQRRGAGSCALMLTGMGQLGDACRAAGRE